MKKIMLLTALLAFIGSVALAQNDQGIKFEKGTFAEILAKAKAQKKLVFMDVYASWCGPCKRMAAEVFTQKKVGDYFNATFVNAKFDAEVGEGRTIAARYGVNAYPTFLLLNGDGKLVGKMVGGSPADEFIRQVKELKAKADAQK
ncbi:thioredoxin family protein [Gallalistipes aquisgranensis]|uniref:thioredoxin family protein n=1 Tax=Gallalistipes aquisgranensis TaxID=2779358 RepID=UPI001CF800D0|nr:thioredoxin family protein [Gallalistipes aquisgranensis]MBE5034501.1 thioredoxin fold domain-containing protein [Gallalistipes aquisgranensis]